MGSSDASPVASDREIAVGASPLSQTMVPNGFGIISCDFAAGTYSSDALAAAALGIPVRGRLSGRKMKNLLRQLTPPQDGTQRFLTFRNPQGHVVRARLIQCENGNGTILIDDLRDITNFVFRLKAREREYRELFDNAPYGIYRATCEGQIFHANPALVRLQGYADQAAMLHAMRNVIHMDYVDPGRRAAFFGLLNRIGRVEDFVSEVRSHGTGESLWISESAWLVRDQAGQARYMAGTVLDITARRRRLEHAREAAETDALTGLSNRASFNAELGRRVSGPGNGSLSLFLIDCDRFKDINDVYGHARGDAVLRICAERLRQVAPQGAVIGRLGGDEFAIMVSGLDAGEAVSALADRIVDAFQQPMEVDGAGHLLGVSVGVSCFPGFANTATGMLRNADLALYSVKDRGRGKAVVFDAALEQAQQGRLGLERDLRGAEARGELELFYQPVVEGVESRTLGLEAFLRWRHPQRGLVLPGEFLPVAEYAGLILPFDEWALGEACRHAAALPRELSVALNLSSAQFRSSELPQIVARAVRATGIDPGRLELEVTESMVLSNKAASLRVLDELRAIGVRMVLDDFGTSQSTLVLLQHFGFGKVKLDRAFVRTLALNPVNRAIAQAVLAIGRELGFAVVAEGVEAEVERQTLLAQGCTLMQGYLFGHPAPFIDVAAALSVDRLRMVAPPATPSLFQDSAEG